MRGLLSWRRSREDCNLTCSQSSRSSAPKNHQHSPANPASHRLLLMQCKVTKPTERPPAFDFVRSTNQMVIKMESFPQQRVLSLVASRAHES